ncbi:olfactory receptor 4D1-like [Latimeria chalumnae]|uniref:olfactory receptor 4D1-like n=1 Tax=Latimeria chalumnae TaxID=7897 RepID=UPI00313DA1AC
MVGDDNNLFHWTTGKRLIKAMENDSYSATFTLTAFGEMDNHKYLYGCCALLGYLIIIFINLTLFLVIVHEKSLHEPMYIFISNLAINGLYGSTAFFPKLIADLMSEKQMISHVGCLIQVFFIHTFALFEFYTLALMAFDRYVAICNPLRYVEIMNTSTVFKLIVAAWTFPACVFGIDLCLIIPLPLCGSIIEKIYCQIWSVLKLSCVDASINYDFGNFVTVFLTLVPVVFILFSYLLIIKTSVRASKEARGKAMQTCAPHLLTFLNYIVAGGSKGRKSKRERRRKKARGYREKDPGRRDGPAIEPHKPSKAVERK